MQDRGYFLTDGQTDRTPDPEPGGEGEGRGDMDKDHAAGSLSLDSIMQAVPSGPWDTWSDQDWDSFEALVSTLPYDTEGDVWAVLEAREFEGLSDPDREAQDHEAQVEGFGATDPETEPAKQDLHSMTDAEWYEMESALGEGYSAYFKDYEWDTKQEAGKPSPAPVSSKPVTKLDTKPGSDPLKNCKCEGPGSKEDKYTTHMTSCVCFPGKQLAPVKPLCTHVRHEVELMDGLKVYASAHRDTYKADADDRVDLGVYLADSWAPSLLVTPGMDVPWEAESGHPTVMVDWPDYHEPNVSDEQMLQLVEWVMREVRDGKGVEFGCIGAHGRTGTMLACLLTWQGVLPGTAVQRIRKEYCKRAIESEEQVAYVAIVHELKHGKEWRHNKEELKLYNKLYEAETKTYYSSSWSKGGKSNSQTGQTKGKKPGFWSGW